jgi:ribosomal protein S18 acetylase RimI-like enzyme
MGMSDSAAEERHIRRALPADAAQIRSLTRAAYAQWIPIIGREPLPMQADYDRAVREHMIDLLFVRGELAALIEMQPNPDHLYIVNVAVSPSFRGQGHGRHMMAHAERLAASLGLREVRLDTNKKFARNIELYRRLGYAIDGEEPFRDTFRVYMSKRLVPS